MIVRCGRCKIELEVSGPGEFLCPSCGTRNAVRGASDPLGVPDLGMSAPPPAAPDPDDVTWVKCPSCGYRFAVGDVDTVPCPTCGTEVPVATEGSAAS